MKKILTLLICVYAFSQMYSQQVNGTIISSEGELKVVKVWGTHQERGYATGYLLAAETKDLYMNYLLPAFGSYYQTARGVLAIDSHIKIDSVYIYEAMAMADGLNASGEFETAIDYIDVLLANCFLDIQNFIAKGLGLENGCSSLISWGDATTGTNLNGKSVLSRHLDWSPQQAILRTQVMIIHFPSDENEQAWAMIGFAGQMSVLSGFNQSGVAVMQHMLSDESTAASLNKSYEPIWFSLRKALEKVDYNGDGVNNCLDINAAINQNTNGYADAYIITGVAPSTFENNSQIATIIEIAPAVPYITIRNTEYEDGIPSDNLYAANSSIARNNALNYCSRYNAVKSHIGEGTGIGSDENWQIMLDYSSSCSQGGGGNIQFMQFVPEDNYLKLAYHAVGGPQACANTPVIYNTLELFEMPVIVNQQNLKSKLKVYPNPANAEITLFIPEKIESDVLDIYNSLGVIVKTVSVNTREFKINVSDLAPGSYFIKMKNSEIKGRFVIN